MISYRLSPDIRMLAVAAPAYLATAQAIEEPRQLRDQNCIRIRAVADGAVLPWRFTDGTKVIDVKVGGSVAVDTTTMALAAALDGACIAYLGSDYLAPYLRGGLLVTVLKEWAVTRPGFHICYAGSRQLPQPLVTLNKYLKERAKEVASEGLEDLDAGTEPA